MKPFFLLASFFLLIGCVDNSKNELINKAKEIHKRVITLDK